MYKYRIEKKTRNRKLVYNAQWSRFGFIWKDIDGSEFQYSEDEALQAIKEHSSRFIYPDLNHIVIKPVPKEERDWAVS